MKSVDAVKMFAMGVIITLLAVIAMKDTKVVAEDHAAAGGLIALTSQAGSNSKTTILNLIDTASKHIATYQIDDNGFAFSSARYYAFDIGIHDLKFSRGGYKVSEAKGFYDKDVTNKPGVGPQQGK